MYCLFNNIIIYITFLLITLSKIPYINHKRVDGFWYCRSIDWQNYRHVILAKYHSTREAQLANSKCWLSLLVFVKHWILTNKREIYHYSFLLSGTLESFLSFESYLNSASPFFLSPDGNLAPPLCGETEAGRISNTGARERELARVEPLQSWHVG